MEAAGNAELAVALGNCLDWPQALPEQEISCLGFEP